MQLAVLSAHVPALTERDYTIAQRAALLCSPAFLAHLVVWREALSSQAGAGPVPESYLAAMRQVVAAEAAAGALDPEDALAAATAIAEIDTTSARQAAKWLLQDLYALGNPLAGVIGAALALQRSSRATFAQARIDLLALSHSLDTKTRAAALCLLGDSYLRDINPGRMPESVAYRFFLAAARENSAPAAQAHYRLGQWYARQGGSEQHKSANFHLEKGAEHGCTLCMAALAELQGSSDGEFALDMRELSEIGDGVHGCPRERPAPRATAGTAGLRPCSQPLRNVPGQRSRPAARRVRMRRATVTRSHSLLTRSRPRAALHACRARRLVPRAFPRSPDLHRQRYARRKTRAGI